MHLHVGLSPGVLEGRRIVELRLLTEQLVAGCPVCEEKSCLSKCVGEKRYGLASVLEVECVRCGNIANINTSKTHVPIGRTSTRGRPAYDINTKSALSLLSSGIGMTQASKYLSGLNIPPVSLPTQKKREREVGPVVENIAKRSCAAACLEEQQLSMASSQPPITEQTPVTADSPPTSFVTSTTDTATTPTGTVQEESVAVTASYDMGWPKRGRAMNSSTGAGALIGLRSAKVLGYASRVKTCRICDTAARAKKDPPPHDCRRNWDKSSKVMEPDVAVQLVKELPMSNVQLGALIVDDDAATIKRVREEVDVNIEKWADLSHTRKNFGSKLDSMKGTHKELKNVKTQAHLTQCFMYAIKTNKNNPEKVSEDLMNVPNHVFGRHSDCGDWCKAKSLEDLSTYIFTQLPRGKPLQSDALHNYLTSLFSTYAASASKLAPCGSSNRSEALNESCSKTASLWWLGVLQLQNCMWCSQQEYRCRVCA